MLWTLVLSLMAFIAIGMPIAFSMGLAAVAALLAERAPGLVLSPEVDEIAEALGVPLSVLERIVDGWTASQA